MASTLLLEGVSGGPDDRWSLDDRDEEALGPAFRCLVAHTTDPLGAAIVHERDGEPIAGWDAEGAIRLAGALPPSYADLSTELLRRHRS